MKSLLLAGAALALLAGSASADPNGRDDHGDRSARSAPAQRQEARPQPSFRGPQPSYRAPQRTYQAPQSFRGAPQQSFRAQPQNNPYRNFQPAYRSAPGVTTARPSWNGSRAYGDVSPNTGQYRNGQGVQRQGANPYERYNGNGRTGQNAYTGQQNWQGRNGVASNRGNWNNGHGGIGTQGWDHGRDWAHDRDWGRDHDWGLHGHWWRDRDDFGGYYGHRYGYWFAPGFGYYQVDPAWYGYSWSIGAQVPYQLQSYAVSDPYAYGLPDAPYGCEWIFLGDQIVLIDLNSGQIVQIAGAY